MVAAGISRQLGEAFENVGKARLGLDFGGLRERIVGPSTSAKSNVTVPVGSPLTSQSC
jgi:hypothetical protein